MDAALTMNGHVIDAVPDAAAELEPVTEWEAKPTDLSASMTAGDRQRLMRMLQLKSSLERQRAPDGAARGGVFGGATAARSANHPRPSAQASVGRQARARAPRQQQQQQQQQARARSAPQPPSSTEPVAASAHAEVEESSAANGAASGTEEVAAQAAAEGPAHDAHEEVEADGQQPPPSKQEASQLHHVAASTDAAGSGELPMPSPASAGPAALARRAQVRAANGGAAAAATSSPFRAGVLPPTNLVLNRSPSYGELEAQLARQRRRAARQKDINSLNKLRTPSGVAAFFRAQRVRAYSLAQRQHNGVPISDGGALSRNDDLNVQSEIATQTGDDFDLAASMLARDEQSLEHLAEADLAYLEMVRTKAGLHHNTAGALATSEAEQALADSWQKLIMLRLKSQKLQLRSRTQPMSKADKERIEVISRSEHYLPIRISQLPAGV